jgi:transcriptional regulator with XRE-family HTH domain
MGKRDKGFDFQGFYRAVDATRLGRGLNWKQVSAETSVSASTLTRMSQDRRPDADSLTALAAWAGLNPATFSSTSPTAQAEPLAVISQQLIRDPNLSPEAASALDDMIKAAYERFARKRA